MNNTLDKEYEASLKSIETENYPDQWFYRPLGFRIAKMLRHTGITPNMITLLSLFVGAVAGPLFYQQDRSLILLGVISLIIANILDCVDGQLARLTGIKSETGRILDGVVGDIWFILIYVFLALKLQNEYGGCAGWWFLPSVLSGLSHLVQANLTDYYKTLHLYFVSREKGQEFHTVDEIRSQYGKMKNGLGKILFLLYMGYTLLQEAVTPKLQQLLNGLHSKYGDDIPDDIRCEFRQKSGRLMKCWIDLMTFNGRTIVLFIVLLTGLPAWLYFLYELLVLNVVLAISIHKHEKICASFAGR
jgi:phosphatidylglycerophosphate synthase